MTIKEPKDSCMGRVYGYQYTCYGREIGRDIKNTIYIIWRTIFSKATFFIWLIFFFLSMERQNRLARVTKEVFSGFLNFDLFS